MTTTIRQKAMEAIGSYTAGTHETLSEAAAAAGARIEVVNVLYKNEERFPESAFVEDSVQASREAQCRGCDKLEAPNRCSVCRCPIVFITSQRHHVCPIGVWQ